MRRAKIIRLVIEPGEAGLYHGTSPDMSELLVSGNSVEEVKEAIPAVVEAIFSAKGTSVRVVEAEDNLPTDVPAPWVIVPSSELHSAC